MKELCIIRHAKSAWEYEVNDKDRPLKERGINDAYLVSSHIKNKIEVPDLVLSSHANRALQTATIFMNNIGIPFDRLNVNEELYDFDGRQLTNVIRQCDPAVDSLMIFGHNYALTSFSNTFGDTNIDNVTTAGVVLITFDIEFWSDLAPGKGHTELTVFPRQLK